ncbi:MAG: winged helix-turn-helix domain-containing protein, partial [Myxococcota bacterium]
MDLDRGTVVRDGATETLTTQELQLLRYLVARRGEDVSRDDLLREVWHFEGRLPTTRAPDFAVRRLRQKLEPDPAHPTMLLTVRNHGYRLVEPPGPVEAGAPRPPPTSLATPRPLEHDRFVGRGALLERLEASLQSARVVTLLGTGGVGKTRLAVHFVAALDQPVAFCDLSEVRPGDDAGITVAMAAALGVPVPARPHHLVRDVLGARGPVLVVLDNADPVAEELAARMERWLEGSPEAHFLVTSRVRLAIRGAINVVVGPLPVEDAAQLFRERATAVGARVEPEEADQLEEVVRLLDCLPLALELAAARSRLLGLRALAGRIHERFRLLTTPSDHARSLRAVINESWERLGTPAQQCLAQLTVFPGSFTLDAGEAVVQVPDAWAVDLIETLLDHSLVRRLDNGRFSVLSVVRQFAEEHRDDQTVAAEQRHGRHYAGTGMQRVADRERLLPERDNLVSACRRAIERRDPDVASRCLGWLTHLASMSGPLDLLETLVDEVETLPVLDDHARMHIEDARGLLAHHAGQLEAALLHRERVRTHALSVGDRARAARSLAQLGTYRLARGETDAGRADLEQAQREAVEAEDPGSEARALRGLGNLAHGRGDVAAARQLYHAAIGRSREAGHTAFEAVSRASLGYLWLDVG